MNIPRVSVIIPTYNRKAYIQEAINSVLTQTYQDLELIVVDDGSTDGTGDVLKQFQQQIRYILQTNQGVSVALNRGILMARGQLIAILADDDLWLPHKLERQVAYLDAHPDVALVCNSALPIDSNGQCLSRETEERFHIPEGLVPFETIFWRCPVNACTILAKREALMQAGLFDVTMRYGEDWDMWARLALRSLIAFVPEPLTYCRVHTGGTQTSLLKQSEETERWLEDVLRSKEKIYRCWPANLENVEEVRRRVTATHLARTAMLDFAHGRSDRGTKRLVEVVTLNPDDWTDAVHLGGIAFEYAMAVTHQEGQQAALKFLNALFEHIPAEMTGVAQAKRKILARFHVELAFLSHSLGERRRTWSHAVQGLWYDPRWWRNRGLLAIAVQSCFGRAPVALLRRLRGGPGAQS
ncbi:MAG: glycosyltransferase [Anaerolineae bacterium]|nr:glycosyltransferase [Anaerolineae bacterium]